MNEANHLEMRRDLAHWEDEQVQWFRDVSLWQSEHQSALAEMEELKTRCIAHGDAVSRHMEAIADHERRLGDHARRLTDKRATQAQQDALTKEHESLATERNQQRDAHERIRTHHLETMAQLRLLVEALCAPM